MKLMIYHVIKRANARVRKKRIGKHGLPSLLILPVLFPYFQLQLFGSISSLAMHLLGLGWSPTWVFISVCLSFKLNGRRGIEH